MSFISFSLNYYKNKIEHYENDDLSENEIYEAKQLLKILDDLLDEGYTYLNQKLEEDFKGVTRLKNIISSHNEKPFAVLSRPNFETNYGDTVYELNRYLSVIENRGETSRERIENSFFDDIADYCKWIGYDNNTAYVFLLRDTLLPYFFFKRKGRSNIFPWLIGRKFLNNISPVKDMDDIVRAVFFDALENGCNDFLSFKSFCSHNIINALREYDTVTSVLKNLLNTIKTERIMVIESGCNGTFPMLLAALDNRVDFRMFTTVPYMRNVYEGKVYTNAYEKNRLFETLACQDLLFQYSGFQNNRFYISECTDENVLKRSFAELHSFFFKIK